MKTQRCHQINKLFCCLITPALMMIFMLYTTAAMALAPIKARYSEEAELVSIAAHLAEVNGYDWSADYTRKRFYMIKDVIRVLGEREQKSTLYPTMRDFMPQYIEVINGFSF